MTEITPEEMHSRISQSQQKANEYFGVPEGWQREIKERVLAGLGDDNYGHTNHLQASTEDWLEQPKQELMDAFAMVTSLRQSRGEEWMSRLAYHLVIAMQLIDREKQTAKAEETI